MKALAFLRAELRTHRTLCGAAGLAVCAAFGSALPDLLSIIGIGR